MKHEITHDIHITRVRQRSPPLPKLRRVGATVRTYTGQEWPIFAVTFAPLPLAAASWLLNMLFSCFWRVCS